MRKNDETERLARPVRGEAVMHPEEGLSTGPARRLNHRACRFECDITIETAEGRKADAKDLLSLLLLGARPGSRLTVSCRGPTASAALAAMVEVISSAKEMGP